MKAGGRLDKKEIAYKIIREKKGIAETADFVCEGITNYEVAKLCREGYIERIRRGLYQFPQTNVITEEQLLQKLLPQGIICMESALFHYGYSDFCPRRWSIAVPRTVYRTMTRVQEVPIKAYYTQTDYLSIGKTSDDFNGIMLSVYDRERTICDCFRYRTKLDTEVFNKAVKAYAADKEKNLANLSRYSKKMKIYSKVMDLMGVLLND